MNETVEMERPLWRQIVKFPLVTMLIGIIVVVGGIDTAALGIDTTNGVGCGNGVPAPL